MNTYTQDVLDLVERWAHAELAGDVDAYADLLDDEFVGVGPVGFVLDKQQWAQRHRGDLENHGFEIIVLELLGRTVGADRRGGPASGDHCHGKGHQWLVPGRDRCRQPGRPVGDCAHPAQWAAHCTR